MAKEQIRKTANSAIVLSAIGVLAAFPFQHTFAGGLLFAGFNAAVIGGLADSFAVSALFGQPLKIRWPHWMGTKIIARNRERLIKELVYMVEHELLTTEQICGQLNQISFSQMIERYLFEQGGQEQVYALLEKFTLEIAASADREKLGEDLQKLVFEHADALPVADLCSQILRWSIDQNYDSKLIAFLAAQLRDMVGKTAFLHMLEQFVQTALASYEGDKFRRRLVDYAAGLNAASISIKVQNWLLVYLQKVENTQCQEHIELRNYVNLLAERLKEEEDLRNRVEDVKRLLLQKMRSNEKVQQLMTAIIDEAGRFVSREVTSGEESFLHRKIVAKLAQWKNNNSMKDKTDKWIKQRLFDWIEQKQSLIGKLVESGLQQFTEEELIELVKDKAGKDLQFIRLNGIAAGAVIGCFLYLSTFWIGGN